MDCILHLPVKTFHASCFDKDRFIQCANRPPAFWFLCGNKRNLIHGRLFNRLGDLF